MSDEEKEPPLSLFRITVVGSSQAGKTCLINAFVNNFSPTVYAETQDPTLYYKTLHLPPEPGEDHTFPVFCEIEDTYAGHRCDDKDCYGQPRSINHFLDMSRPNRNKSSRKGSSLSASEEAGADGGGGLLSSFDPPRPNKYTPLATGRMGFMIVFDLSDDKSLADAIKLHFNLEEAIQRKKVHMKPVVYLVANKTDKDPGLAAKANRLKAEQYANDKMLEIAFVSAFELMNVKRLFRTVLMNIRSNPILWKTEWKIEDTPRRDSAIPSAPSVKDVSATAAEKCTVM